MPALPTLNLLSLNTDPKSGALPFNVAGGDGEAFHAALSEHLAQTSAESGDLPLPAFSLPVNLPVDLPVDLPVNLPVDLNVTVENLLEGTVLVQQVDSTDSADETLPLDATSGELTLSRSIPVNTRLLTAQQLVEGSPALIETAETAVATGAESPVTAPSLSSLSPLAPGQLQQARAPEVVTGDMQQAASMQSRNAFTGVGEPLAAAARASAAGMGAASGSVDGVESPLAGAVADALTAQGGRPATAASSRFESGFAGQAPVAPQANNSQALPGATLPAPVTAPQMAATSEAFAALASADSPAIDPAFAVSYAPANTQAREPAGAMPTAMMLNRPLASPEWNQELGERIVWLAENNKQSAELQLNPRELGPLAVRISVADDVARVTFTAQHAMTREALEAAMPQLREMLQSQGLSLGEANVSADNAPGKEQEKGDDAGGAATANSQNDTAEQDAAAKTRQVHDGLFDGYA